MTLRLKNSGDRRREIEAYAREKVASVGKSGMEMASLGHWIHAGFKGFRVKDYGYSSFERFVQSIPGLEVIQGKGSSRIVKISD